MHTPIHHRQDEEVRCAYQDLPKPNLHAYALMLCRCAKPIAAVLVATYFMGTLLFAPIRAVALLVSMYCHCLRHIMPCQPGRNLAHHALQVQTITQGWISAETAFNAGQQWVSDAVVFAPLVTMLVVRSCELHCHCRPESARCA